MEITDKVIAFGNRRFIIHPMNPENNGYENTPTNVRGLVDFSMDFTQETTPFEADDEPEYIVVNGTPTGSGTATLRGLTSIDSARIYPAVSGVGTGVHFGEDLPVKYFGFIFDEQVKTDGVESINRYVVYRARATNLPSIATASVGGTTITPRNIPIAMTATTIHWTENGKRRRRIFSVFNNLTDPEEFARFENGLVFPSAATEA